MQPLSKMQLIASTISLNFMIYPLGESYPKIAALWQSANTDQAWNKEYLTFSKQSLALLAFQCQKGGPN